MLFVLVLFMFRFGGCEKGSQLFATIPRVVKSGLSQANLQVWGPYLSVSKLAFFGLDRFSGKGKNVLPFLDQSTQEVSCTPVGCDKVARYRTRVLNFASKEGCWLVSFSRARLDNASEMPAAFYLLVR